MLTQTEAETLIAMRKRFLNPHTISLPPGVNETHELKYIGACHHRLCLQCLLMEGSWHLPGKNTDDILLQRHAFDLFC